ncbi:TRAP transporter permease [Chloroflexota bacterium]
MAIFNIFRLNIAGMVMVEFGYFALLLAIFLPLVFLFIPATKRAPQDKVPWYDLILAVLSIPGPIFAFIFALEIIGGSWSVSPPTIAVALGLVTWGLIIEGIRRATSPVLAVIVLLSSVYPLFGESMPSILISKSYSLTRIIGYHYLSNASIFGLPMQVFARILIGFMFFGVALDNTGGGKFLLNLATGLLGRVKGGPALVAVLGSSMLASLSGSSVANVISTGSITIPAMKKLGIEPHVAGAIESCASTGGVLMPPVMGATAFVMAAMLRIPYATVIIAAAIPMIVYYACLFGQVYFYAQRHNFGTYEDKDIPPLKQTFVQGWFYLGSLVVLVYLLFYIRVEAWAPFYAAGFLFLCALLRKETRPNLTVLYQTTISLGRVLIGLTPTIAGVGMIIGSLVLTGVGQSLSSGLVHLAQGNLYILMGLGAIGALIMGMGMTTTAVYIFMAIMFAPALTELGVNEIAAHFFFLYWGMISFITPPVCISVYAAAALAGSGVMRTGLMAVRLGIVGFIIPFAFVLNPALVAQGTPLEVLWAATTATIGAVLIAAGVEGYQVRIGTIGLVGRVIFSIAGFLLLFTWWAANVAGAALAVSLILYYLFTRAIAKRQVPGGIKSID